MTRVRVRVHDGQPWPISLANMEFFSHMDTGYVQIGVVEHLQRDGVTYYAIRDGGYRYHPELAPYVGQLLAIWKNAEEERLELRTFVRDGEGEAKFIRVLTEEVVN